MKLRGFLKQLEFWKPKAARIAAGKPSIPEKGIDVQGGMRLLHRLKQSLWGRVGAQVKRDEDYRYGATCQSHHHKRRGYTRAAIRPSDRRAELARSRRPAKRKPAGVEKQRVFIPDPITGQLTEKWLRPADWPAGAFRAGDYVTLDPAVDRDKLSRAMPVAAA